MEQTGASITVGSLDLRIDSKTGTALLMLPHDDCQLTKAEIKELSTFLTEQLNKPEQRVLDVINVLEAWAEYSENAMKHGATTMPSIHAHLAKNYRILVAKLRGQ